MSAIVSDALAVAMWVCVVEVALMLVMCRVAIKKLDRIIAAHQAEKAREKAANEPPPDREPGTVEGWLDL